MVKLAQIKKLNTGRTLPDLSICPSWYGNDTRAAALNLCRSGELPRNALIAVGVNKSEVDMLVGLQDDPATTIILDELYGELNKCLSELKCSSYKFVTLKHDAYDQPTLKFLIEQDKRREALRDQIQADLANDPYWNKYNNQPMNLQYEIMAI